MKKPNFEKSNEIYWFLTPQEPTDETQHTPAQKRILQKLIALQKLEHINPQDNQWSPYQFVYKYKWIDSTLDTQARQAIKNLLVEFHDILARRTFHIGIKTSKLNWHLLMKAQPIVRTYQHQST